MANNPVSLHNLTVCLQRSHSKPVYNRQEILDWGEPSGLGLVDVTTPELLRRIKLLRRPATYEAAEPHTSGGRQRRRQR